MADSAAAPQPTHAEMIAEMQRAGFTPQATSAPAQPDLTHDQMIKEMQSAGFTPQAEGSGNEFLDANPHLKNLVKGTIDALPVAGGLLGGGLGATAGSVIPAAGTAIGGVVGTGMGAVLGSTAKDALNAWVFKPTKTDTQVLTDAAKEGGGQMAAQMAGESILKAGGAVASKVGEAVVPKAVIERYQQAADAIKEVIGASGGDTAEAADQARASMGKSLDEVRGQMNDQIANTLKNSTKRVDPSSVIDVLEAAKGRVHGDLPRAAAYTSQIDSYLSAINKMKDENGQIFVSDFNSLKRELSDEATAAFRDGTNGTQFADAAQKAAGAARGLINKAAPEIASANDKLHALHLVEDNMNKSILTEGKSAAGLIAAGEAKSEGGKASAKALRTLGEITGQDFLGKAQDIAAMRAFSGDSILKRGVGAGAGAALGAGAAEIAGSDPYHGALAGGAIGGFGTSPAAVKMGLDAAPYVAPLAAPAAQTLGQAVMHGSGAARSLKQIGQPQQ